MSISDLTWVDEHSGACHKEKMNGGCSNMGKQIRDWVRMGRIWVSSKGQEEGINNMEIPYEKQLYNLIGKAYTSSVAKYIDLVPTVSSIFSTSM
jgi:hypothetical protein